MLPLAKIQFLLSFRLFCHKMRAMDLAPILGILRRGGHREMGILSPRIYKKEILSGRVTQSGLALTIITDGCDIFRLEEDSIQQSLHGKIFLLCSILMPMSCLISKDSFMLLFMKG